ncbi:MAG: excinuclease ABC subunit UvrA, partial [Pirellulaceae bacterium]
MPVSDIVIKGAREHNLCDVDLVLPRNQLICLTGVSGSGKSSLAFDTVYAEGQRRYVESLSSFARQFLGQMPKPDVDLIAGLSPSISISQKSSGNNPRSTVGTITEIYDYLRVLFARVGQGFCPRCQNPVTAQTTDQIIAQIMQMEPGTEFSVLAPLIRAQKGEHKDLFQDLLKQGFIRVRVDGEVRSLSSDINLDRQMRHDIEVVVDRLNAGPSIRGRLGEAVEAALRIGDGNLTIAISDEREKAARSSSKKPEGKSTKNRRHQPVAGDRIFSVAYACSPCGISFQPPTPQLFSFNSPQGMCGECDGLGHLYSFDPELLIPDPRKSFKKGAVELLGKWSDLGRWRRHIYQGVADSIERKQDLEPGAMLETPWSELTRPLQHLLLYGTGEMHITFTWRGGQSPMKYGGQFEGIIPELNGRYRNARSAPKRRQLEAYMNTIRCGSCDGQRLNLQARNVRLETTSEYFADSAALSLPDICNLSVNNAREFFSELVLDDTGQLIAGEALKEIRNRLGFLLNVGLDYLTLDRTAPTLSGGESQRIRLASQIGSGLVGVLYILDEPSIGLHARDNDRLISTLQRLRDQGNTVLVVEHDEDTMRAADHMIDFGPGPGVRGGQVVAEGPATKVATSPKSVTGKYLAGNLGIAIPEHRRSVDPARQLKIVGARQNNLKNIDVSIPLGTFTCITGVSGSGKSSLVNDILVEALREDLNRGIGEPGLHQAIEGVDLLDKLIAIDQSPIGRTPRSNPGTYIKVFDEIRKLFTQMPEAKRRGFAPGRFSFNVKAGRCEACEGNGSNRLEMDFLADVWVTCPVCEGKRFDRETLQVKFKGYSIADVLEMDVQDGLRVFENIPKVFNKLQTLHDVGLDYLKVGQPSPTLSGGEAQRIKLARELTKKSTGSTLYLLDEPTTGLHFADIQLLLDVLQNFVKAGNTVLVVEHNMDVIKTADWIIDLGPEGGAGGGTIVDQGPPEKIAAGKNSYTGRALAKALGQSSDASPTNGKPRSKKKAVEVATKIDVRGASQHNLRKVDVSIDREKMTVFCG